MARAALRPQGQRRLDRSHCGLPSLVLARPGQSGPIESLFGGIASEQAKPYRHSGLDGDTGEAVRRC
jgi:hypothetical protein